MQVEVLIELPLPKEPVSKFVILRQHQTKEIGNVPALLCLGHSRGEQNASIRSK